jgi:hypothetical protein
VLFLLQTTNRALRRKSFQMRLLLGTSLVALCVAISLGASQAYADPCNTTIAAGIQSDFQYNELGEVLYKGPVVQVSTTETCGDYSVNLFNTLDASTKGKYGNRNPGDENDLTLQSDHTYNTKFGPIEVVLSASYWKYAPFSKAYANVFLTSEVSRDFTFHQLTITPVFHVSEYVGIGAVPTITSVHPSVREKLTFSPTLNLLTEVGISHNFISYPAESGADVPVTGPDVSGRNVIIRENEAYVDATLNKDLGHGFSAAINAQAMLYAPVEVGFMLTKKF